MENHKTHNHNHHILPDRTAIGVGAALLFLTVVTVWIAGVDLGRMNFPVAMLVATIKGSLVALIFMNLKHDTKENGMIFLTSFLFLAIFIVLTGTDLFFRGDVYVKGPLLAEIQGGKGAPSKFKKPWNPTDELVTHGKELYNIQCVSCHGTQGLGDGPAAAGLNPKPRNFTQEAGWINGRKPSQIFKTLKEGVGKGMASFATLPAEDRWALSHYVATLGPNVLKDDASDLAKVGVDPNSEGSGEVEEKTIPVELAIEQLAKEAGQK